VRKISLFIVLLMLVKWLDAQDVLFKKNGEELKVKVLEILQTEVKYKNFDNPDGPVYTISKSDVARIKYANGTDEVIQQGRNNKPLFDEECLTMSGKYVSHKRISKKQLGSILLADPATAVAYRMYKDNHTGSMVTFFVGISALIGGVITEAWAQLNTLDDANVYGTTNPANQTTAEIGEAAIALGVGLITVSIVLHGLQTHHFHNAIRIHNSKLNCQNKNNIKLDVGLASHGVGLTVRF